MDDGSSERGEACDLPYLTFREIGGYRDLRCPMRNLCDENAVLVCLTIRYPWNDNGDFWEWVSFTVADDYSNYSGTLREVNGSDVTERSAILSP